MRSRKGIYAAVAGAAGLLALALWPEPPPPPAPPPQPLAETRAPRPSIVRRYQTGVSRPQSPLEDPPPPATPPTSASASTPAPVEPSSLEEPRIEYALDVRVVDEDGQPLRRAVVESEDCEVRRFAPGGRAMLMVPEPVCTVRAGRRDGMLMTWSEPTVVNLTEQKTTELELYVPSEKTAGMGLQIVEHPEGVQVMRIVAGSPAERAGLQPGDVVVEVDGVTAGDLSVEEFVELGTGPVGSEVQLRILRPAAQEDEEDEERELTLVRQLLGDAEGGR